MNIIDVKIRTEHGATIPKYQSSGAAGFDLHAYIVDEASYTIVRSGERQLIRTGLSFAIPEGYELQLRPRSGLALNKGITLTNSPATIDSDFRGEVKVIVQNAGDKDFVIYHNDRIAQGVIAPVYQANFVESYELDDTERGLGGFGHTGK